MKYLANAFSLNMVAQFPCTMHAREIPLDEARAAAIDATSIVGHADTAAVMASQLGMPVAANRATVALKKGDVLVVGQYRGPRLPEGATALPEGASISWYLVEIA